MLGSGSRTLVVLMQLVLAGANAGMTAQPAPARTTDREVDTLLARLEKNAEQFRRSLADAPDHEWTIGWEKEPNINHFITAFVQATRRLRDQYDRDEGVSARVDEVLRRGVSVDSFMERHPSRNQTARVRAERAWVTVRRDLETLARAYGVPWHRATPLLTGLPPDRARHHSFIHVS
jgi:hypothetical protein